MQKILKIFNFTQSKETGFWQVAGKLAKKKVNSKIVINKRSYTILITWANNGKNQLLMSVNFHGAY